MELTEALQRRRMVRRYASDRSPSQESISAVVGAALRAPSAGFSQGTSLLVLAGADVEAYWDVTAGDQRAEPDRWLRGLQTAPVLVGVWASEQTYRDRYAEPDKGWPGPGRAEHGEGRWSAPYWYVDAGMAVMAMLLAAVDEGLGACFFGVPPARVDALRAQLGVPADQLSVGTVSLGLPAGRPTPPRRPRRNPDELVHFGRWASGGLQTGR